MLTTALTADGKYETMTTPGSRSTSRLKLMHPKTLVWTVLCGPVSDPYTSPQTTLHVHIQHTHTDSLQGLDLLSWSSKTHTLLRMRADIYAHMLCRIVH